MPGFSHGTAGVAYALAAAGRTLNRSDLVDVAARGACALLAIGHHRGGWAVPHAIPPRPRGPEVSFGWCHGAAGTVRLFLLLNEIDPQPRWQRAIGACLQAVRDSRLPIRLYPGYWDNLARCCGTAGVGQLLLDRYHATGGSTALLDWADTLAADVVSRAARSTPDSGVTTGPTPNTPGPRRNCPRNRASCRAPPESPAGWPDSTPFTPAPIPRPSRPGPAHHGFDGRHPGPCRSHTHRELDARVTTLCTDREAWLVTADAAHNRLFCRFRRATREGSSGSGWQAKKPASPSATAVGFCPCSRWVRPGRSSGWRARLSATLGQLEAAVQTEVQVVLGCRAKRRHPAW